jgi:hypothetical protein
VKHVEVTFSTIGHANPSLVSQGGGYRRGGQWTGGNYPGGPDYKYDRDAERLAGASFDAAGSTARKAERKDHLAEWLEDNCPDWQDPDFRLGAAHLRTAAAAVEVSERTLLVYLRELRREAAK